MKKDKNNIIKIKKIIRFVIASIIIALLFIPLLPRLILSSVENYKMNLILKINKKEFIISYIHSVNKSKVRDYYFIDDNNNIILEKTRFVSYGAGIPEPSYKEKFVVTNDYMEINNMDRLIQNLYLFVGTTADHIIMTDNEVFELNKIFKPQTSIKIEYKNVSLFFCFETLVRNTINLRNMKPERK